MAANYDPSLPTAVDRLRFFLGDTNMAVAFLQDETYTAILDSSGDDESKALATLAKGLLAQFSGKPDVEVVGNAEIRWGNLAERWRKLVASIDKTTNTGKMKMFRPARSIELESEYVAGRRTLTTEY